MTTNVSASSDEKSAPMDCTAALFSAALSINS
jgi:hypothetical protein